MNLSVSNKESVPVEEDIARVILLALMVGLYVGFGFVSWPIFFGGKSRIGFVLSVIYIIHMAV